MDKETEGNSVVAIIGFVEEGSLVETCVEGEAVRTTVISVEDGTVV